MATVRFKKSPSRFVHDFKGDYPRAFEMVRRCLEAHDLALEELVNESSGSPAGSGSSGGSFTEATRMQVAWRANGPYRVDTAVDGAWVVPTAMQITSVWLWRETAGTTSSTILDLNRNGVTMYADQSLRPTIAFDDTSLAVGCALPTALSLVTGDIVTVDTDQIEGGRPENWTLTIEGA